MYGSDATKELIEAICLAVLLSFIGILLGIGDQWLEDERKMRKITKMEEYRIKRKRLRLALKNTAVDEDLLETVEYFSEKYYPGEHM